MSFITLAELGGVVQLEELNLVGPSGLGKSKEYILDGAVVVAEFRHEFALGHAEYLGRVDGLDSLSVGDSIVLCLIR